MAVPISKERMVARMPASKRDLAPDQESGELVAAETICPNRKTRAGSDTPNK